MNFDDTEYPISDVIPIPTAEFFPDDRVNLTPLQTGKPENLLVREIQLLSCTSEVGAANDKDNNGTSAEESQN